MTRQPTYPKRSRAAGAPASRAVPAPCAGFPLDKTRMPAPARGKDPRTGRTPRAFIEFTPDTSTVDTAMDYIQTSQMAAVLDDTVQHRRGRPRSLGSDANMLGFYLNALQKGHQGCVLDAARALSAMPRQCRRALGIDGLDLPALHRRLSGWFNQVAAHLQTQAALGPDDTSDVFEICQAITRSSLTETYLSWPSIAVDGTDFPTFGNAHVAKDRVVLDGAAVYDSEGDPFGGEAGPPPWAAPEGQHNEKRLRIFGIGDDGRRVYTKDTEARAGYRTATGKRSGDIFIGYEATLATPMPAMRYTNAVTTALFGPTPPTVALGFNLTPAGTHRGHATMPIIRSLDDDSALDEVAADRGITNMKGYLQELRHRGIKSVHTLTKTQRRIRPGPLGSFFADETLLSDTTPDTLLDLPLPPRRASAEVRAPFEAKFNDRARYRWRTHAGPDDAGRIRLSCPICTAEVIRCLDIARSMRLPSHYPLVVLPNGRTRCCDTRTITFGPTDYPLWMGDVVPFTTAHNLSYGRRNAVETLNSFLHGLYVDIDENWAEPFGTVKRALLLAFTLAGLNHHLLT